MNIREWVVRWVVLSPAPPFSLLGVLFIQIVVVSTGFDGGDGLLRRWRLRVWESLFSSINPPSMHFRIVRCRKDRGDLWLLLSAIVFATVVVLLSYQIRVVLSDSVVAVFAWFGGRLPSGSLCVCFSFADRRQRLDFGGLVLVGSRLVFVGCWFS
ncbi:transmembrane protein, putative [Medicago truncatula]|uniref:Transmembrane protein, putative n=1 Tax=Medicago truncatula TaxID=3880 RepID=G7IY75_MEDTR|nr:transmembrane protein, putative [Medicago truncatula]